MYAGLENQAKIVNQQVQLQQAIKFPTGWERVKEWFEGISYVHVVAQTDGDVDQIRARPARF